MRFVIYDEETMEPITVVSIAGIGEKDIEQHGRRLKLSVPPDWTTATTRGPSEPLETIIQMRTVDLTFEPLFRNGRQASWLCFTREAELAMALDPAWLPGQQSRINAMEAERRFLARLISAGLGVRFG